MDNEDRQAVTSGFHTRTSHEEPNQERALATSDFSILHNTQNLPVDRSRATSSLQTPINYNEVRSKDGKICSGFSTGHHNEGQGVLDRPRSDTQFSIGLILQNPKQEGLKYYMIKARELQIVHGDNSQYWKIESAQNSSSGEIAVLLQVCWLEIHGSVDTQELLPSTTYGAYFVYNLSKNAKGFDVGCPKVELGIEILGIQSSAIKRSVCLDSESQDQEFAPHSRGDGWLEIEIGDVYNVHGEDLKIRSIIGETKSNLMKSGLFIQGIEFRPKGTSITV